MIVGLLIKSRPLPSNLHPVKHKAYETIVGNAGVIHKIPCGTCTKAYISQTGCTLEHQLKEHRRALVPGEISLSAVAQHVVDKMHGIDCMGATVVDSCPIFTS